MVFEGVEMNKHLEYEQHAKNALGEVYLTCTGKENDQHSLDDWYKLDCGKHGTGFTVEWVICQEEFSSPTWGEH